MLLKSGFSEWSSRASESSDTSRTFLFINLWLSNFLCTPHAHFINQWTPKNPLLSSALISLVYLTIKIKINSFGTSTIQIWHSGFLCGTKNWDHFSEIDKKCFWEDFWLSTLSTLEEYNIGYYFPWSYIYLSSTSSHFNHGSFTDTSTRKFSKNQIWY